MVSSETHFAEFGPHSRYKQLVLTTYFETWGRKLLLRPRAGDALCYVDACAGRGMDGAGHQGSPVLAANAAAVAEKQLAELKKQPVTIQVIAIEKDRSHFDVLRTNLAAFPHARALRGTLGEHLRSIQDEFGATPTLFFIDPFGLEPLKADLVAQALAGDKNEALILFAGQAALRHFGAATAIETRLERRMRELGDQTSMDLFPETLSSAREQLAPEVQRSKKAREITRVRAVEILDAAFGGHEWLAELQHAPRERLRTKFVELYVAFLRRIGIPYVLQFPVFNEDGGLEYHLVHASRSPAGKRTMKEAITYALTHGPLGEDVAARARTSMECDLAEVVKLILRRLSDRRVRWAPDSKAKTAPSLRRLVLEETDAMPFQLDTLKHLLEPYRDRTAGRHLVYPIPRVFRRR